MVGQAPRIFQRIAEEAESCASGRDRTEGIGMKQEIKEDIAIGLIAGTIAGLNSNSITTLIMAVVTLVIGIRILYYGLKTKNK